MPSRIIRAADRGLKDAGWLQSHFSLSFGPYANPERSGFGLLRVFNDDFVQPGRGFGLHAHSNMEIISVMLAGRMNHKDTLGYSEEVGPDWVQIMSAGSGLRHEEHNIGDDEVNFLQIWIEPKLQNIGPRYQRRHFPREQRRNRLTTIVSNEEGTAHCWINQNARLSLGYFEAGQTVEYTLNPLNKCVWVFGLEGELRVNGETLARRDSLGLWETATVHIDCSTEVQFLLIEAPINH
ncbi:pirin family protein [Hymenobacter weizhouensis]|uniref:pirin family protein n=1 Tax=Hymenobacter sp. YIM 151500-1 TaxID=2987689 RepID=UPI0022275238|nr:pirin family protein [Hymenobacter sp. YIM 151500-1]UYZ61585.1 pirin family protein [Hymenobacter sp. YIM 151500-1]